MSSLRNVQGRVVAKVGAFKKDRSGFTAIEFAMVVIPFMMLVFGIIGWFMEENGFPIAPALLGIILGRMLEETFLTSMIKAQGDFLMFFSRPVAATFGVITILIWLSPLLMMGWRRYSRRRAVA